MAGKLLTWREAYGPPSLGIDRVSVSLEECGEKVAECSWLARKADGIVLGPPFHAAQSTAWLLVLVKEAKKAKVNLP